MSQFHRVAAGAALLALGLGMSGCGGSANADAGKKASVSPSAAPTSASPTPTKKPKPKPLSRFEGNPAVKVARKWAAAAARDVNARSHTLKRGRRYELPSGYADFQSTVSEEYDKYYPGPFPFTPVSVSHQGASAHLKVCLWAGGFALKHKGGPIATKRQIIGAEFAARRIGHTWKLSDIEAATVDCSGVKVKGVTW